MDCEDMRVVDLKALVKERGLRGYSRLNKAELIAFIRNNLQPHTRPPPIPAPRPPPPIPIPAPRSIPAPRPPPALRTRPPRPTRPPPPPPVRPRQQELKPYQLKPKRGKETFIEPPMKQEPTPTSNPKQIKRMKKKLGKLNKKIRHSKKKHNNLISKQNSIKKIKQLEGPRPEELKGPQEPEESFNTIERE